MRTPLIAAVSATLGAAATVLLLVTAPASAQPATGTVTGRVLWSPCIRLPLSATAPEDAPDMPQIQPMPGVVVRPQPIRALPAGAVLVAAQNTAASIRTDESGRFSLSGVPAGQYLTVAAGPVAGTVSAVATRPNVYVEATQTVDVGNLLLGSTATGLGCRALAPGAAGAEGVEVTPEDVP